MGGATCKMAANQSDSRSPLVRIVLWNIETTPIFLMRESVATVLSFVVLILPANTGRTWQRNDKTPSYNIPHTKKKNYMLPWVSYLFPVATLICMLILGPPWSVGYKLSYNHTYFINSTIVRNCHITTWDTRSKLMQMWLIIYEAKLWSVWVKSNMQWWCWSNSPFGRFCKSLSLTNCCECSWLLLRDEPNNHDVLFLTNYNQ